MSPRAGHGLLLAGLLVVAACGSSSSGPSSAAITLSPVPTDSAIAMADRIDPCQLLTPAELKGRFGTLPTNQPVAHDGDGTQDAPRDGYGAYHGCEWSVPDLTSTVPGVFLLVRLDLVSGRSNRAALRTIESTMALDMHTYHLDGLGDGAAVDDWHSRVCVLHGSVIFCIAAPQTEDAIALARIAVRRLPAG